MAAILHATAGAAALPLQRRAGCEPSTSTSSSFSSPSPARHHHRLSSKMMATPRVVARHHPFQQQQQQPFGTAPTTLAAAAAAAAAASPDHAPRRRRRAPPLVAARASSSAVWPSGSGDKAGSDKAPDSSAVPSDLPPAPEGLDQPFSRRHERDPRRLLGVDPDASFEEIQDARNFLSERYRGHEASREAIELAFDALLQAHLADRAKLGFRPPLTGRAAAAAASIRRPPTGLAAVAAKVRGLWDPTVTARTVVNEGSVFAALAVWALFAGEQSFPLAAAVAYCVYQFQSKRVRRDPEGPFFVNSPVAGAVLSTACCLALAVGAGAVLAPVVQAVVQSAPLAQARTFATIATLGTLGVALK